MLAKRTTVWCSKFGVSHPYLMKTILEKAIISSFRPEKMPFSFCANTPLYMEVSVLLWFVSRHRKQPRMSFQSSKTCVCLNMMSQHTNHSFTLFNKVQERPVILFSKHQQQFDKVPFESSASGKPELSGLLLLSPSQGFPPLASEDWKRDLDQLILHC